MSALDNQVGGNHYRNKAIQPIEFIMVNGLNFCEGSIVKYITRWREKGGIQDLQKVIHYAQFLIEQQLMLEPLVIAEDERQAAEPAAPTLGDELIESMQEAVQLSLFDTAEEMEDIYPAISGDLESTKRCVWQTIWGTYYGSLVTAPEADRIMYNRNYR